MIKNFKNEENQALWDRYYITRLDEINSDGKEYRTRPELIVAQYKTSLLDLEEATQKAFRDITVLDIEQLKAASGKGAHITHLNNFFRTVVSNGWLSVSGDIVAYLIPKEYKVLVNLLINRVVDNNSEVITEQVTEHNSIKEVREATGLSQKDFAVKLSIGEKRLRAYEKGTIECPKDILSTIMSYNRAA